MTPAVIPSGPFQGPFFFLRGWYLTHPCPKRYDSPKNYRCTAASALALASARAVL